MQSENVSKKETVDEWNQMVKLHMYIKNNNICCQNETFFNINIICF